MNTPVNRRTSPARVNPLDLQESLLKVSAGPTVSAPYKASAAADRTAALTLERFKPPLPSKSRKPSNRNITPSTNRASFGEIILPEDNKETLMK